MYSLEHIFKLSDSYLHDSSDFSAFSVGRLYLKKTNHAAIVQYQSSTTVPYESDYKRGLINQYGAIFGVEFSTDCRPMGL